MGNALASLGFGQAQYDSVIFADQTGPDGKPTEFKPAEHRKYDAKVEPTSMSTQSFKQRICARIPLSPISAPRLGSPCCNRFS